jgi:hypothetical protein
MVKKPIEERDSFNFTIIGVAADQLGELVALVTKMGFTQTRHELVTDVIRFKNNRQHDVKSEDFLLAWIEQNPTFRARDAVQHFEENDRTAGACYTSLKLLARKGALKKLGEGNYTRADIKAIEAPKKRDHFDVDHREFILRYARAHHGRMSVAKLRAHFEANGRKPVSVGGALNVLVSQKMVKLLGDGEYVLLAKGGAKPHAKTPEKSAFASPKPNGNGLHIDAQQSEAVIHG